MLTKIYNANNKDDGLDDNKDDHLDNNKDDALDNNKDDHLDDKENHPNKKTRNNNQRELLPDIPAKPELIIKEPEKKENIKRALGDDHYVEDKDNIKRTRNNGQLEPAIVLEID